MSYKAKKYGFIPRFIETSGEINEFMKIHAINLAERGLKSYESRLYGSTIAILGLAYKKNINDARESPAIDIIEELDRLGAKVVVFDPYVERITTSHGSFNSKKDAAEALTGADCAIVLVDHDCFKDIDIAQLAKKMKKPIIIDCKNIYHDDPRITYLGIGKVNKIY